MPFASNSLRPVTRRPLSPVALVGWLCMPLAFSMTSFAQAPTPDDGPTPRPRTTAKNVILFIGDGVDVHQLSIARAYLYGPNGSFSFEDFPHRADLRVQTVSEEDAETPVYVADSASSGTALAAGVVTSRGRIATTAAQDRDVVTILEKAQAAGKLTGVVTTASLTDATPASFYAHTSIRFCQGPNDMKGSRGGMPGCPQDQKSRGGSGSIAEQLAAKDIDVLLGGGTRYLGQRGEDGEIMVEAMQRRGYRLVDSAEQLASVAATIKRRLLGLFGNSTLPVEWAGVGGATSGAASADGVPVEPTPFRCEPNPNFGKRPTLEAMTRSAIEVLARQAGHEGFFLMVESASIDKQAHGENPCGQIGETLALSRSVQVAREFAERRRDTLVLVTSDHGHAPQLIPYPSLFDSYAPNAPVKMYAPGKIAVLESLAGGLMAVTYGTNANYLEEHTGTQVPAYAMGPGAERVRGLMDQREIFDVMVQAFGWRLE